MRFFLLFFFLIYYLFSIGDFLLILALISTLLEELTFARVLWLAVAGWVALALISRRSGAGAAAGEPALLPIARLGPRNRRPLIYELHLLLWDVEGVARLELFNLTFVLRLWRYRWWLLALLKFRTKQLVSHVQLVAFAQGVVRRGHSLRDVVLAQGRVLGVQR